MKVGTKRGTGLMKRAAIWLSALTFALTAHAEPAGNLAVSDFNGRFDASIVGAEDDAAGLFTGAITLPVGDSFGLQLDGFGLLGGEFSFAGAGTHFFWRDPEIGLLGVYGDATQVWWDEDFWLLRAAVEGEVYLGSFSLEALVGAAWLEDTDAEFFDQIDLSYYASDDLRFSIGHRYEAERHALALGSEYLMHPAAGASWSLVTEAAVDEDNEWSGRVGLRTHFNGPATLIEKHRRADPLVRTPNVWAYFKKLVADQNVGQSCQAGPGDLRCEVGTYLSCSGNSAFQCLPLEETACALLKRCSVKPDALQACVDGAWVCYETDPQ